MAQKSINSYHINSCYSFDLIAEIKQIMARLNEDISYKCAFSTPILPIVFHCKYSHNIFTIDHSSIFISDTFSISICKKRSMCVYVYAFSIGLGVGDREGETPPS